MDELVRAAMARWANVPDIFGWLSLTSSGHWRLHPDGKALIPDPAGTYPEGESISNVQILAFINRNYTHDQSGRWFFQNGPQRVFVRIDDAPLLLSTCEDGSQLQAHTGQRVDTISAWYLNDDGHLYAQTNLGPGLIAGRDLMQVLDTLTSNDGMPLDFDALWSSDNSIAVQINDPFQPKHCTGSLLRTCHTNEIETVLGFVRNPALGYA